MKMFWIIVFAALPTVSVASIRFGPSTSGGGVAVVCRDKLSHRIDTAELLDLYESREVHGFSLPTATGLIGDDYLRAVNNTYKLQRSEPVEFNRDEVRNISTFLSMVNFTRRGEPLPEIHDRGALPAIPAGCAFEQVAIFHAQNGFVESIDIDSEIWGRLDSLNQAALVTHELFYAWESILSDRTSETTRALVAHVYAIPGGPTPVYANRPANAVSSSALSFAPNRNTGIDDISSFYLYRKILPSGTEAVILDFDQLAGRPLVAKTVAVLPYIRWNLRRKMDGINFTCLVNEPEVAQVYRVPVNTSLRKDWEIEVRYVSNEPVTLALYENNERIAESYLTTCE